jgi:hypothetical protein
LRRLVATTTDWALESELLNDTAMARQLSVFVPIVLAVCPDAPSLPEVVCALRRVATGRVLVLAIVANNPHCFGEAVSVLFDSVLAQTPQFVVECLEDLSGLSPGCAMYVRDECARRHVLPGLAVAATLGAIGDEVDWLAAVCNQSDPGWIRDWLASPAAAGHSAVLLSQIVGRVVQPHADALTRRTALRTLCAAHATLGLPAAKEELAVLLDAGEHANDARTLGLFLALAVSCKGATQLIGRERIAAFLGRLAKLESMSQ